MAGRTSLTRGRQHENGVCILQVEMIASIEGETPGVCSVGINEAMNVDVSKSTQLSQVRRNALSFLCLVASASVNLTRCRFTELWSIDRIRFTEPSVTC